MISCIHCGRGFHSECAACLRDLCHPTETNPTEPQPAEEPKIKEFFEEQAKVFKDPGSTGRKRAARLYPIDEEAPCDWKNQKECGGGRYPIIGCWNGKQKHRHHGPIKDTMVNRHGNVHCICTNCHIRWHELNDVSYVEADYRLLPHQPVPATDLECIQNDLDWETGEMAKRYTLKSSTEGLKIRHKSD